MFRMLLRINIFRIIQYRVVLIVKFLGEMLGTLVKISLWVALYKVVTQVNGTSLDQMLSYTILTSIVTILSMSTVGTNLGDRISNGLISIDYIRPYDLKHYLFQTAIATNIVEFVAYKLLIILVLVLYFKLQLFMGFARLAVFILSAVLGCILMYYHAIILGMLNFWLQSTWYIAWVESALLALFGGSFIPLWFYPHALQVISRVLPYRYMYYEPIAFYLGKIDASKMKYALGIQVIWVIAMYLLQQLVWKLGQKKVMIFGG